MSVAQDAVGNNDTYTSVDQITGTLYGGMATAGGKAEGNTITFSIDDSTTNIPYAVYVGHATGGNVADNTLIITKNSNIKFSGRNLIAGYLQTTSTAAGLTVKGNSVRVEDGAVVELDNTYRLIAAEANVANSSRQEPD